MIERDAELREACEKFIVAFAESLRLHKILGWMVDKVGRIRKFIGVKE